jgi:hypothetical protein
MKNKESRSGGQPPPETGKSSQVSTTSSETVAEETTPKQRELDFGRHTAETSKQAYRETRPMAAGRKALIREALREAEDGFTRYELSDRLSLPLQSVCGLVRPLVLAGLLVESGDTRPAPSGSKAKVVRLSPKLMGGNTSG